MNDISALLQKYNGKRLVAVFAHPDDVSYSSAILLLRAKQVGIETHVISLSGGDNKTAQREFAHISASLKIDDQCMFEFSDTDMLSQKAKWKTKLHKKLTQIELDILLTYDESGVTGNASHVVLTTTLLEMMKDAFPGKVLLWRVPDNEERRIFASRGSFSLTSSPTHVLSYGFREALHKVQIILLHHSRRREWWKKMQVFELYLFDHRELYHMVDLKAKSPKKLKISVV